jgi:hypothetical protein
VEWSRLEASVEMGTLWSDPHDASPRAIAEHIDFDPKEAATNGYVGLGIEEDDPPADAVHPAQAAARPQEKKPPACGISGGG